MRYFFDFCEKYCVTGDEEVRVRLFLDKLQEKKQSEGQRRRAYQAASLYFEMLKKSNIGYTKGPLMFKPVKQNKAYQDVVEQIQEAIMEGSLKSGSLLPAERELKEQFGISRGTLREALRVLEQKGLIEIRTGVAGGSVIREVNSENLSDNLGLLIRNRAVSLRDLAEFREGMEGNVAALATQRSTEPDRPLLERLMGEAGGHFKEGLKGWDVTNRSTWRWPA